MSNEQKQNPNAKDVYAVCQQNVDKYLDSVKNSVPQYHQSVTNAQQEYLQACENVINSSITLQKEYARKSKKIFFYLVVFCSKCRDPRLHNVLV